MMWPVSLQDRPVIRECEDEFHARLEFFVVPKEVDRVDSVDLAGIYHFERGAEDIEGEVDLDGFNFVPGSQSLAHSILGW